MTGGCYKFSKFLFPIELQVRGKICCSASFSVHACISSCRMNLATVFVRHWPDDDRYTQITGKEWKVKLILSTIRPLDFNPQYVICEISDRRRGGTWFAPGRLHSQQQDWLNSSETTTVFHRRRVQPLHPVSRTHRHPEETRLQAEKKKLTYLHPHH